MVTVKTMIIYGNPKVAVMLNALATYYAEKAEDIPYQDKFSFEFDSEETSDAFINDVHEFFKAYVRASKGS